MPDFSRRYLAPSGQASPLPYYIPANDRVYEVSTLSDAELAELDWHVLTEINSDYDPTIMTKTGEIVDVVNKTLTHVVEFRPNCREVMMNKIDAMAEVARSLIATSAPLQTMEYAEAARQANAYLENPSNPNENWKFLLADIGRTLLPDNTLVSSLYSAAQAILGAQAYWANYAGDIRDKRLGAKAAIRDAETDEDAYQIFKTTAF